MEQSQKSPIKVGYISPPTVLKVAENQYIVTIGNIQLRADKSLIEKIHEDCHIALKEQTGKYVEFEDKN